jgi:hypothetical protein
VSVKPESYGLKDDELMLMTDKEINGMMPLKKLAPYKTQVISANTTWTGAGEYGGDEAEEEEIA